MSWIYKEFLYYRFYVAMIASMADPRLDSDYRILTEEKSSFSESVMSEVSSSVHIHEHHHNI